MDLIGWACVLLSVLGCIVLMWAGAAMINVSRRLDRLEALAEAMAMEVTQRHKSR